MSANKQYKTLFKVTSLFGVVEILRLLLRVIVNYGAGRLLGVNGFGLLGLIENTTQLIASFTNFGINFIGVREVAAKNGIDDLDLKKTLKSIQLFSFATGILAALVSILLSYYLSILTFKTPNYYIWFIALSIYFVFTSLTQSKIIFLEGTQNFSKLIRINILVNFSNTLIILACYFFFKIQGIIVAMIVNAVITYIIYLNLTKIPKTTNKLNTQETIDQFKKYIKSGSLMALNVFIGFLCYYIIRVYLNKQNEAYLSYYNVGTIFLVSYLGMIFIAMGKYFLPKLTQTIEEKKDYNQLINNQLELVLLVIQPAILILYCFGNELISIFIAKDFIPAYQILIFGLASLLFKGFNYAVGYLFLSYQNYKQYFFINALSDILNVILTISLFKMLGLVGIGLAILVNYIIGALYLYIYVYKYYHFSLTSITKKTFFVSLTLTAFVIISYYILNDDYFFLVVALLAIVSIIFCALRLDNYIFDSKIQNKIKSLF